MDEGRLSSTFDVSRYFFSITPDDPDFISNPATYPLRTMNFNSNRDRERIGSIGTDLRWETRIGQAPAGFSLSSTA